MQSFFKRLLIFISPLVVIFLLMDYSLNEFVKEKHDLSIAVDEYSVWNDIYNQNIDVDIAIYGSSRAWVHFNPDIIQERLNKSCYNFGLDGHNFTLQYLRHLEYLENNPTPKEIYFSIDFLSFAKRAELYNYEQFLPYLLWNSRMKEYTEKFEGFSWVDYYIPLCRYFGENKLLLNSYNLNDNKKLLKRSKGYLGIERQWEQDFKESNGDDSYTIDIDYESLEIFRVFLKECQERGIKVTLVYAPVHKIGQDYITNHGIIDSVLDSLTTEFQLDFYNYMDCELSKRKELFYNSTHMNKEGAEAFNDLFIRSLLSNLND